MGMTTGGSGGLQSRINVTPLVDVVLVLLIIFMLVTPLISTSVPLPATDRPAVKPERPTQVVVVLNDRHEILVQGKRTTGTELSARLGERLAADPGSSVVIRADRRLSYGDVKRAVISAREAGFTQVGLVSELRSRTSS